MKIVTSIFIATALSVSAAWAADDVVIVYDASGSMWGQIDGTSKIEIAQGVMADLVQNWDENTNLGLVAYGHRRQGDCSDIETLISPAKVDKAAFINTINAIRPHGKTPISASVQHAAELMSFRDAPATIVLISDGLETCHADPCAVSAELAQQGVKFTTHVIGFDLKDESHASLSCIAENTGGVFVPAGNAAELHAALAQVQSVMDLQPATDIVEPAPADTASQAVKVSGPAQVTTGASLVVTWSQTIAPDDFITIVPFDAKEGSSASYIRVRDAVEGSLVAPAEAGLYELRYIQNDGQKTLGAAPVEVIEAEIGVLAPQKTMTGAAFDVSWAGSVHPRDFITIVPMGSKPDHHGDYIRVHDTKEGVLTAPAEAGLYEVRYILNEGHRMLASTPIEVVEPVVTLSAPDIVRAETMVEITWSDTIHGRDYLTIVPAGTADGVHGDYFRAHDATKGETKAPAEPGLYEIRYVLNQGSKTLARAPLEVVGADAPLDDGAGLNVPAVAGVGETIAISWKAGSTGSDQRITIARKDQPDFSWISAYPAADETTKELIMPDEPGLYEIRFLDISGRKVLGRSVVKVE